MNLGKDYKVFSGDARNSVPNLLKECYKAVSVADVMKNRLEKGKKFSDWKDNYFDTLDGTIYNTKGDAKIVLDADYIKNINSSTSLKEGAVVLDNGTFENTTGKNVLYLPKNEIKKIHGKTYAKESVKDSEVWNFLARDNKLLSDYADFAFEEYQARFAKYTPIENTKLMELYFDSPSNFEKGRAWCVDGVENGSSADARDNLGIRFDRFVGFSGGAAEQSSEKDLESKIGKDVLFAINSGIAFEHNGFLYVPTNAKNVKLKK